MFHNFDILGTLSYAPCAQRGKKWECTVTSSCAKAEACGRRRPRGRSGGRAPRARGGGRAPHGHDKGHEALSAIGRGREALAAVRHGRTPRNRDGGRLPHGWPPSQLTIVACLAAGLAAHGCHVPRGLCRSWPPGSGGAAVMIIGARKRLSHWPYGIQASGVIGL